MLNEGLWMIMGHYLAVSKWRSNFKPSDQEMATTLVWLRVCVELNLNRQLVPSVEVYKRVWQWNSSFITSASIVASLDTVRIPACSLLQPSPSRLSVMEMASATDRPHQMLKTRLGLGSYRPMCDVVSNCSMIG